MTHKSVENQGYTPSESLDSKSEKRKLSGKAKVGMAVAGLITVGSALTACSPDTEAKGPGTEQAQSQEAEQTPEVDPLSPEVIESTEFSDRTPEQLALSYEIPAEEYKTPEDAAKKYFELESEFMNTGNNAGMEDYIIDQMNERGADGDIDVYFYEYMDKYNDVFTNSNLFTNDPIHPDFERNINNYKDSLADSHNSVSKRYDFHKTMDLDGNQPDYHVDRQVTNMNIGDFDTVGEDGSDHTFQSVTIDYELTANGSNMAPTEREPNPGKYDSETGSEVIFLKKATIDGKEVWQIANVGEFTGDPMSK